MATNVGVLATAQDARRLGYAVTVLADVTTAGTLGKHERALHELAAAGIPSRSWADVLGAGRFELGGLGEGATLVCGALDGCVDATTFDTLEAEVAWSAMHHRGGVVPRLVALQVTGRRMAPCRCTVIRPTSSPRCARGRPPSTGSGAPSRRTSGTR